MVILGATLNALLAGLGGLIGLGFKSRVSSSLADFLLKGQGLCVILVAVQGMAGGGSVAIATLSVALGSLIGFGLDIDGQVNRLGAWAEKKLEALLHTKKDVQSTNFATGYVSSTLFTCTGAMAILGSLASGMQLDHSTLLAKGVIDMIVCIPMAASLGIGVPFCAVSLFVYESVLSLLASVLAPLLSQVVIQEMVVTGSLLLLAVGTNLLDITKIKVANMLPAAFLPVLLVPLVTQLSQLI